MTTYRGRGISAPYSKGWLSNASVVFPSASYVILFLFSILRCAMTYFTDTYSPLWLKWIASIDKGSSTQSL